MFVSNNHLLQHLYICLKISLIIFVGLFVLLSADHQLALFTRYQSRNLIFFWTNLVFSLSWMMGGAGDHDKKIWSSPQSSILSSKSKSVMTKDCLLVKSHLRMAYIHHVQIYISLSCYQSLWVNKGN